MRFAGIDIAAETHGVAVVDEAAVVLVKATPFTEDAEGDARRLERLGTAPDLVVVMEATGHCWKNLFAPLAAQGIAVALALGEQPSRGLRADALDRGPQGADRMRLERLVDVPLEKPPPAAQEGQILAGVADLDPVRRAVVTAGGAPPRRDQRLGPLGADLASFRSAGALTADVGVVPALRQAGKRPPTRAGVSPIGPAALRAQLGMPTLTAVQTNPWLRACDERRRARGKLPTVALVAAARKLLIAVYYVATHRRPFNAPLVPAGSRACKSA